jgi:hypothetical protein
MIGESQEPVGAGVGGGSQTSNKTPTLEEYGTNLTNQAEEVWQPANSFCSTQYLDCKGMFRLHRLCRCPAEVDTGQPCT